MMLRTSRCLWSIGGSVGFRRYSVMSGLATGDRDRVQSGAGLAAFTRAAAEIFAAGGSGLGLWFLADPGTSFAESSDPRLIGCGEPRTAEKQSRFLLGDSFRRRDFFKYEKRMRLRSTPEKIFEYLHLFGTPKVRYLCIQQIGRELWFQSFPHLSRVLSEKGVLEGRRNPVYCTVVHPHCFSSLTQTMMD